MDPSSFTYGDLVATQVTVSALIVYALQWIKRSSWVPWITEHTKALNRWIAALVAAAAAIGIHTEFDATAGTLVITGLTLAGIAHGLFEWARSWIFQQMIYDGVIARDTAERLAEKQRGSVSR